ncbi:MAG: C_GCAxxG_C_C family protein [Sterolibacteriaceae bacterium]|nr:C_GCAxxG_C_C family protein [Sterolibacteriaceae bacterium]
MDSDRIALAEEAYQKATQYELDYGCCPQCVLATLQETIGIVDDQMVKASHGLSGGGAPFGEGVCGTLTGGLLALSAKYGRDRDKPDKGRYINNVKKAKKLRERFRAEFGGITCRELQQQFTGRTYDMWNAAEYEAFDSARGGKCAHATGIVTKWVVEIL